MRQSSKNNEIQSAISERIDGFFILGLNEKKVVQNYSHDFTYHLCKYLDEAFKKDKSLEALWNESLNDITGNDFINIIKKASEYYLLSKFSSIISPSISEDNHLRNLLKSYKRDDIPELVATNRFIDLFNDFMGRIDLLLPVGSYFIRNEDDSFTIHNNWFSITLKTIFQSEWANTGIDFCGVYLGLKKVARFYPELSVSFEITVTYHNLSIETDLGKQYSELINEFIDQLNKDFGKDYYFEKKIQWDQTSVILEVIQKRFDTLMEVIEKKR